MPLPKPPCFLFVLGNFHCLIASCCIRFQVFWCFWACTLASLCIPFSFSWTEKTWKMIAVFWICVSFITCFVLCGVFVFVGESCTRRWSLFLVHSLWYLDFTGCSQLEGWSKRVESSRNFRSCFWSQTATSASHSTMIFRRIFLGLGWSRSNPSRVKFLWCVGVPSFLQTDLSLRCESRKKSQSPSWYKDITRSYRPLYHNPGRIRICFSSPSGPRSLVLRRARGSSGNVLVVGGCRGCTTARWTQILETGNRTYTKHESESLIASKNESLEDDLPVWKQINFENTWRIITHIQSENCKNEIKLYDLTVKSSTLQVQVWNARLLASDLQSVFSKYIAPAVLLPPHPRRMTRLKSPKRAE